MKISTTKSIQPQIIQLMEIEPGMNIGCNNLEEKKILCDKLHELGYVWRSKMFCSDLDVDLSKVGDTIHVHRNIEQDSDYITYSSLEPNIKFNDLFNVTYNIEETKEVKDAISKIIDLYKSSLEDLKAVGNYVKIDGILPEDISYASQSFEQGYVSAIEQIAQILDIDLGRDTGLEICREEDSMEM